MTCSLTARTCCEQLYQSWHDHFLHNRESQRPLPWDDPYHLNAEERRRITRSIQQFQLGEWARGRGLRQRAAVHPIFASDTFFQSAMQLFIEEEQGHSMLLGRFLDREGIPRLKQHWVNGTFRALRKLAGLEVCVTVLVTAEVLAVPFYRALRDATRSALLASICAQLLRDEAHHLKYQALTIGLLRRQVSPRMCAIRTVLHSGLFHGTALILWRQHHPVFRAAGWNFQRFWREARYSFVRLERMIRAASADLRSAR